MPKKKKSLIPGFSWNRALGVTKAKQDIARITGIPTTKAGQKRKLEHIAFNAVVTAAAMHEISKEEKRQNKKIAKNNEEEYIEEYEDEEG